MEKLNHVLGAVHEGIVNLVGDQHAAKRNHATGDPFRKRHEIGHHAESVRRKHFADSSKTRNDFIEYEQNAMARAYVPDSLKVANRRHDHTAGALHRFDHHGSDRRCVMQGDQALEIIRGLCGINLVGMDVVEVAPAYDVGEITSFAAATLAAEFLCLFAANPHREDVE